MLPSVLTACALASLVTACSNGDDAQDDQLVGNADGTVTVEWTVGGSTDSAACAAQGASQIEIDVYDQSGAQVGSYPEPCTDGSYVISLSPGRFSATAHLLDATGQARTTVVDIDPFDIVDDTNFTIPVDFPISSFL
jgi:hypothetical protein